MQRSTSHESHLRNKVHHGTAAAATFADAFPKEQALIIQKISEISGRRQIRANSTEVSENGSLLSSSHSHTGGNNSHNSPNFIALPSPQCSNSNNPHKTSSSNIFFAASVAADQDNKTGHHHHNSPSEHRWTTGGFGQRCDVCQKKMVLGRQCKKCKFLCHKDCEKKSNNHVCAVLDTDKLIKKAAAVAAATVPKSPLAMGGSSGNHHHHPNRIISTPNSVINVKKKPLPVSSPSAMGAMNLTDNTSSSCNSSEPNSPNVFNKDKFRKYLSAEPNAVPSFYHPSAQDTTHYHAHQHDGVFPLDGDHRGNHMTSSASALAGGSDTNNTG
jgi:hypothetical protein